MSFAQVPRMPGTHRAGLAIVVALHALLGLALMQGLARTAIESLKPPISLRIVPEAKPLEEPPPSVQGPKPAKVPPHFAKAPKVVEPATSPARDFDFSGPAIPASPTAGDAAEVPMAPPLAPSTPRQAARPAFANLQACAPRSDDYPLAARRAKASGTTRLRFTIGATGGLVQTEVVRSAGPTREHRLLDRMAEYKLAGCSFSAGVDENGSAVGATFEVDYVWKLDD